VKLLASPASLKGVLGAIDAAAALVEGAEAAGAKAEALPIADGGGGTAAVLASARGGSWHEAAVSDPLGRSVTARWLMLPDRTAVLEAAEAIGLPLVAADERDPLRASSRGLGELIQAALEEQPDSLLVCLGDTATVDGGAGLLEVVAALPVPARAACDVRNPLLGPRGAARAFWPQHRASPV
jgi:glycerate kinase